MPTRLPPLPSIIYHRTRNRFLLLVLGSYSSEEPLMFSREERRVGSRSLEKCLIQHVFFLAHLLFQRRIHPVQWNVTAWLYPFLPRSRTVHETVRAHKVPVFVVCTKDQCMQDPNNQSDILYIYAVDVAAQAGGVRGGWRMGSSLGHRDSDMFGYWCSRTVSRVRL